MAGLAVSTAYRSLTASVSPPPRRAVHPAMAIEVSTVLLLEGPLHAAGMNQRYRHDGGRGQRTVSQQAQQAGVDSRQLMLLL